MQKTEITKLIKQEESEIFERKKSLADKDRIAEVVCSFANGKGGKVLVGVSDKGKIIGVDIGKQTIEGLTDVIIDNTDPKIYPEITALKIEDKNLILISVEVGSHKPHTVFGRAFKRVGKNTKLMSQSEYESLLIEKNRHKMQFDTEICERAVFEDISNKKINWYLREREKARNISKKIKISTEELLVNLGCLQDGKPTNAGILFFGKQPLRFISHAQLRLAKIKGVKVYGHILDRLDCQGALWEMVDQAEEFIRKNIRLLGFRTEKSFRRDDKFEYPIKALREAIINGLIHRDYFHPADVRVLILDDRIEIASPGSFPKGVTPKKPKHKPVNKILSNLMYDIGFIEKYGTGIYLENELCLKNGNKKPIYDISENDTKVIFKTQVDDVTVIEVAKNIMDQLNVRQQKVIDYLQQKGKITRQEYEIINDLSKRTANRDINKLIEFNIIKVAGKSRAQHYILK